MLWFEQVVDFLVCADRNGIINKIKNYFKYKKLEEGDIIQSLEDELTLNAQMITPWELMIRIIEAYNTLDRAFLISRRDVVVSHFSLSQSVQNIHSEAQQLCDKITYYRLAFFNTPVINNPIIITLNDRDREIDLTENGITITLNDVVPDDKMIHSLTRFLKLLEALFKDLLSDYWDSSVSDINMNKVKILHIRISEFSSRTRPTINDDEQEEYYYKLQNSKQVYLQDNLYTEYYFYEGHLPAQIGTVVYRLDFSIGFQVYYMNFAGIDNYETPNVNIYVYDQMIKYMMGIKTHTGFVYDYISTVAMKQYFVPEK